MEEFDAVIIGAGHQGLIAATLLAEAGLSAVVVEAAPQVGGAVQSAEVTLPNFVHDLYATNMNLFLGSPFFTKFGDEMGAGGLRFSRSPHPYASVFPDGKTLRVTSDQDATAEMWRQHSAEDAQGWHQLRRVFDSLAASYLPLYANPLPSWSAARTATHQMWRNRRNVGPGELAAVLLSSTRTLGERYFATPEAKSLAAAWGMHLDYAPDIAGGATFPVLEMYADMLGGMSVVEGGAGRLPCAIAGLLRNRGGTVLTGTRVARINLDPARASGVTLADGQVIRARHGIVCTATLPHLVHRLLAHTTVPTDMTTAADRYRFGPGTFMLHLALEGPIPWRDERLAQFAYVHAGSYVDDMARTYQQALAHELPDTPLLVVGQTSVVDPTRVPTQGKHLAWVQVRTVPAQIKGDANGHIHGTRWADVREPYAERIVNILQTYAPGLRTLLSAQAALSPDDLETANANLVGGDSVSGSHHLDQFAMLRPSLRLSRYRTPIPGLYLAGAGTWPGAGVNGISGQLAAQALLRARRRRVSRR